MLDHEGYLALYERYRDGGALKLRPGARIFRDEQGGALRLAEDRAGKSGRRKVELVDWDGDGDLDLLMDAGRQVGWYENRGPRERPLMVWRGVLVDREFGGHNPAPSAADWNADGRLDLMVGAEDGFLYFFDGQRLGGYPPSR